jgi:hypothetical protein
MESKGFTIPSSALKQLNEFSDGGFALFLYDDRGNPNVHTKFDTNKDAMALQMFISNWAEALNELSIKSTLNSLSVDTGDEDPLDDFEIPEDEDDEADFI